MFSEEPCQGKKLAVKSDGKCVLLPLEWYVHPN
jgi:hypothetical protein